MVKDQPYTLGLDIGIASVGAALLGDDRIIGLHVRTFDRAETAKEGESLNKIRRDARLTRRRIRRRAHRLLRLRRLFKRLGLIAQADAAEFSTTESPWELRAQGLDRCLSEKEWAAVLYHMVKHRGFQSNRKSEAKADEKAGEMLSGVNHNQQLLQAAGYRTIGELATRHPDFAHAKRNKGGSYTHTFARAQLEDELKQLFEYQRTLGNSYATHEIETAVHTLLMARKPTLSGENLLKMVGRCTFEPGEYRAPKASYTAERFVWLTKLNNLRISGMGETRPPSDAERQALINLPFTQSKLTYKQVRKALSLQEHERFVGLRYPRATESSKSPEDASLFEAKAFHALRKTYESAGLKLEWQRDSQNPDRLDALVYALTVFKDDAESREWLNRQGIETTIIDAVLEISFSDFVRLSIKALRKVLPFMETGQRYDEAVQAAGYAHHSQLQSGLKSKYIPRLSKDAIANPVVYRALNQARKLVNTIVREYGPPAAVHIELARDLSRPFDERNKIRKEQEQYQKDKAKDIAAFEETFGFTPKGLHLTKWRLYREQCAKCAYSLEPLDLGRLFEDGYAEVDHALPYSRSFDDGMNNKALVLTAVNRNKGNQTPYEFLDGKNDSERWRNYAAWVTGNKNYREAKRRTLLRKDFGLEAATEFRERHLTDTRYIAKEFKRLVETHLQLTDGKDNSRCVVVSGRLTAYLRARWGLIKIREQGDLHHALDAAVVAACSRSMVKRLSDYSRRGELELTRGGYVDPETGEILDIAALRKLEDHFPEPWPHFRTELLARLSPDPAQKLAHLPTYSQGQAELILPVRVSRAPTRRGLGTAHQETIRSAKMLACGKSSVKTPIEKLKLKNLPDIVGFDNPRNKSLIAVIEQRLREHGDDGKKAFKEPLYKPSAPGKQAPTIRSVKLLDTQKSGLPVRGGIANNGDMLRVDIFTDGKNFHTVPLYVADAVKAELPLPVMTKKKPKKDAHEPMKFLCSLHKNDWIKVIKNEGAYEGYFLTFDSSDSRIRLTAHDRAADKGGKDGIRVSTKTDVLAIEKYHVDYLGHLHRVHKETRKPLSTQRRS